MTFCLDILQGLRLATDMKYVAQYSCGPQYQIWSNSIGVFSKMEHPKEVTQNVRSAHDMYRE
jgi:hypothetical protein